MWPPTHSMASVPMREMPASSFGMKPTIPRPIRWEAGESRLDRARPTSSIFTISATTP